MNANIEVITSTSTSSASSYHNHIARANRCDRARVGHAVVVSRNTRSTSACDIEIAVSGGNSHASVHAYANCAAQSWINIRVARDINFTRAARGDIARNNNAARANERDRTRGGCDQCVHRNHVCGHI